MENINETRNYIIEEYKKCFNKVYDVDYKFHHNTYYNEGPSIITNGILSIDEQISRGIIKLNKCSYEKLKDTSSHVNGVDHISISCSGLKDLGRNEDEYDPTISFMLDFLLSNKIQARRFTRHYGNEFLVKDYILPEDIKILDLRFIKYLKKINEIDIMLLEYNNLIKIAEKIYETNSNIRVREMSNNELVELDINKVIELPKIYIKK